VEFATYDYTSGGFDRCLQSCSWQCCSFINSCQAIF